ncbi:MAG: sugar ABC transporter permease [bacterium]|nr:sugar ABC transporter permease [bacterium]
MQATTVENTASKEGSPSGRSRARAGIAFASPAVLLLTLFMVVPFGLAAVLSFTNWKLLSPLPNRWVGFENYTDILTDSDFWGALQNNLVFSAIVVPLQTGLALLLAVLVNQKLRGSVLFRTIYFVPITFSLSAASIIWLVLLIPSGMVNTVMEVVTFGAFAPDWLRDTSYALVAVIIVSLWASVGFQMVILLAALQDVPKSLYEAAAVDGAGAWKRFRNVTVPGIRHQLFFVATITMILSFRLFDQVYILPDDPGGPLGATNTIMVELVDTGLNGNQIGKASAIAVLFFLIVLFLTIFQRKFEPAD